MRKLITLCSGLVLVAITAAFVVLSGCSQPSTPSNKILLWHWMTDRNETFQKLAQEYQKETGIEGLNEDFENFDELSDEWSDEEDGEDKENEKKKEKESSKKSGISSPGEEPLESLKKKKRKEASPKKLNRYTLRPIWLGSRTYST